MTVKLALASILVNYEVCPSCKTINPPPLDPKILTLQPLSGLQLQFSPINGNLKDFSEAEMCKFSVSSFADK